MGAREEIQKRIERKRAEIVSLEAQVREAEIYIQALEDTLKILPKDTSNEPLDSSVLTELRPGSRVAKARDFLRQAGQQLQVMEILKGIGEPPNAANRAGLSSSISAYVREGRIFTRPAPNTFGLVEFSVGTTKKGPPPGFGTDNEPPEDDDPLGWLRDVKEEESDNTVLGS